MGFAAQDQLRVFLPDIHLITEQRRIQGGFQYATNHLPLLLDLVCALKGLQAAGDVIVYQIGDLIDLWRETDGTDPGLDVASAIQNDHEDLMAALLDPGLNTQFLLGNHDYDLYRFADFAAWERYLYLSNSAMLLHGDIFDWVEKLPDQVQNFFTFLFAPSVKPASNQLEKMRPLNVKMRGKRDFRKFIQDATPAPLGALRAPRGALPARWNVQAEDAAPGEMLKFLASAHDKCAQANLQFGTSLNMAVIGHTHHARIALRETAGEFFVLMDCGAWLENCVTEHDANPRPNAQLAALGANDARIYQLSPRNLKPPG